MARIVSSDHRKAGDLVKADHYASFAESYQTRRASYSKQAEFALQPTR